MLFLVKGGVCMAEVVGDFMEMIGADIVPPETIAELIPYLIHISVSCFLVSCVFAVIGKIIEMFSNFRRW